MRALGACSPLSRSMSAWPPAVPLANEPGAAGNDGREAGCPHQRRRYGDRRLRTRETGGREMMSGSAAPEPGHRSRARPRRRCARHGRPRSACSPSCSAPAEKAVLRTWKAKLAGSTGGSLSMAWTFGQAGRPGPPGGYGDLRDVLGGGPRRPEGAGLAPVRAVCRLPGRDPRRRPVCGREEVHEPPAGFEPALTAPGASLSLAASCGYMASPASLGRTWSRSPCCCSPAARPWAGSLASVAASGLAAGTWSRCPGVAGPGCSVVMRARVVSITLHGLRAVTGMRCRRGRLLTRSARSRR